jgi:hypothetical protein
MIDRPQYWVLDEDDEPRPVDDLTWAVWFEEVGHRRVLLDVVRRVEVSTVFLGLDHAWMGGPPVLWETMIFGGVFEGAQRRYRSKLEALEGHMIAVRLVEAYGRLPRKTKKALRQDWEGGELRPDARRRRDRLLRRIGIF